MLAIDRWRKWRPSDEKFDESPGCEPTKLTEPAFGGFVSSSPGQMQNFSDAPPPHNPQDRVSAPVSEELRLAQRPGGRVFPHCPRCASYALYRRNNIGNYECMTCGLQDIEESTARRVM